jgi:hypothetical protein
VHTSEHVEQCLYSEIDKVSTDERYEKVQLPGASLQDHQRAASRNRLESSISFFAILSHAPQKRQKTGFPADYKNAFAVLQEKAAPTREEKLFPVKKSYVCNKQLPPSAACRGNLKK